jgi:hypothetical protein
MDMNFTPYADMFLRTQLSLQVRSRTPDARSCIRLPFQVWAVFCGTYFHLYLGYVAPGDLHLTCILLDLANLVMKAVTVGLTCLLTLPPLLLRSAVVTRIPKLAHS